MQIRISAAPACASSPSALHNNFGQRTDLEASRKVIHKAIDLASPCSTPPTSIPTWVVRDRARRCARRPPQGHRAGDQIFQADGGGRHQAGASRYIMSAVEASLTPAEDRLHRSLPAARLRPADADRRNPARARRSRAARCATSAIGISLPGASRKRNSRARDERQPFCSCQDEYSSRCAASRTTRCRSRNTARRVAVLSAGERPAHRQIQEGRSRARTPARQAVGCAIATPHRATRTSSRSCAPC